jgi:hypothetical protein
VDPKGDWWGILSSRDGKGGGFADCYPRRRAWTRAA